MSYKCNKELWQILIQARNCNSGKKADVFRGDKGKKNRPSVQFTAISGHSGFMRGLFLD